MGADFTLKNGPDRLRLGKLVDFGLLLGPSRDQGCGQALDFDQLLGGAPTCSLKILFVSICLSLLLSLPL